MSYIVVIHWTSNDSYAGTRFDSLVEAAAFYCKAIEYAQRFFEINTIRLQKENETHWNNETLKFWKS